MDGDGDEERRRGARTAEARAFRDASAADLACVTGLAARRRIRRLQGQRAAKLWS